MLTEEEIKIGAIIELAAVLIIKKPETKMDFINHFRVI